MVSADTARSIVGIIGNVTSFGLFLSPVPTFLKILKKKAVEGFSPIPYLATLLNCMLWVFYGIITPDSLLVITINAIGLALEAAYLTVFLIFATAAGRRNVVLGVGAELAFMAAAVVAVLLGASAQPHRSLIVGVLCVIFGTCMYAAPLSVMMTVVRTRSVKYMPFSLSLASLLNGVFWTMYALIRFDIFITIPNGLGTLFALAQLVLYACYCGTTPKEAPAPEAELPVVDGRTGKIDRSSSAAAAADHGQQGP